MPLPRRSCVNFCPRWNRRWLALSCLLLLLVMLPGAPALAAPAQQSDPAAQCRQGIELAREKRISEAIPLLRAGMEGIAPDPSADPALLGDCARTLGESLERQGDIDGALAAYDRALQAFERSGDHAAAMKTLERTGKLHEAQGRVIEALAAYRRLRDIARAQGKPMDEFGALASTYFIFFYQQYWQEALDTALQMQPVGREITEQTGVTSFESFGLVLTMQALVLQQRCAEASAVGQQALDLGRDDQNLNVPAYVLSLQGDCAESDDRNDEALQYYQQALEVSRARGDRNQEFIVLKKIALVHQKQRQYDRALTVLQQALQQARAANDRDNEVSILRSLIGIYQKQGRYDEALEAAQQALQHAREQRDLRFEALALKDIGDIYRDQQRYAEAIKTHQQALEIARRTRSPFVEGHVLHALAEDYEAQQRLEEALAFSLQALDVFDGVRTMANAEEARTTVVNTYYFAYDRPVWLAHRLGDDDLAFAVSKRGRARAFLDTLATGAIELSDAEANALFQEERRTFLALQQAQTALNRERARPSPDPARLANLEAQVARAETAHAAVLRAIAERDDKLASLIPARLQAPLTRAEVQALLPPDTTLVAYWIGAERTLAFVVAPDRFTTVELSADLPELDQAVHQMRAVLVSAPPAQQVTRSEAAERLYQRLIAPLRPHLRTRHLIVVPHGDLHFLPFAALSDDDGRFLGDAYALSLLPSASALRYLQRPTLASGVAPRALVLANPDYTLPGAVAEAQAIARLFESRVLNGDQATEQALREYAGQADILHFATHGTFLPDAPLASYLVLVPAAPAEATTSVRGGDARAERLEAAEVYGLDLRQTRMVVLSACESNLSTITGNDPFGLTRAFFFAGTSSVVASLWLAPDDATTLLMERFYTHLRAGASKAEALQRAQREVRERYPHPYYWAGFVLAGDGSQALVVLPWWQRVPWWVWGMGALALLGEVIGGFWITRRWRMLRDRLAYSSAHSG